MVALAHNSQQGMVKTKNRIRSKVWFPRLDGLVEQAICLCKLCQVTSNPDAPTLIATEDMPAIPWHWASADFGNLPDRRHMLVMIDDLFQILRSEASSIYVVREGNTYGGNYHDHPRLIQEIRIDCRSMATFAEYLQSRGTKYRTSMPRWPQTNGEEEHFMRNLMKVIRIAQVSHNCV